MMLSNLGHSGLDVLASLALVSTLSTLIVLAYLVRVLLKEGRAHGTNQALILTLCFMLAGFAQVISLVLSFHWANHDAIPEDNALCVAQGGLLTFGSLSSGLFAFAIAIHSLYVHAKGMKLSTTIFFAGIAFIWILSTFLAAIGPVIFDKAFYGEASILCWIRLEYPLERLLVHDLWLFLTEFGTIVTYLALAILLVVRLYGEQDNDREPLPAQTNLATITAAMMLFPMSHIVCFLLLVTARLMGTAGKHVPLKLLLIAACFVASSGWLSALLFAATQDILMRPSIMTIPPPATPPPSNVPRLARPPRRASPSGPFGSRVSAEATLLLSHSGRNSRRVSVISTPNGNRLSKRLSGPPEGERSDVNITQDVSVEEEEIPAQDLPEHRMIPAPVISEEEARDLERFGVDPYDYCSWR